MSVQKVIGVYSLTAWPWLTNATALIGEPSELVNIRTGRRIPIPVAADQQTTCSANWCRITTLTARRRDLVLQRPAGGDRHTITGPREAATLSDVAMLDRFEVLSLPLPTDPGNGGQRLAIYDVKTRWKVVVAPVATSVGARGTWPWWATGDFQARTWHFLDMRSLR